MAILGLVFVCFSLLTGKILFAFALLSFFGLAFSALSFSGIDQAAKDPVARKWFLVTLGFGCIGLLVWLAYVSEAIFNAEYKTVAKLSWPIVLLVSAWLKHGKAVVATVRGKS